MTPLDSGAIGALVTSQLPTSLGLGHLSITVFYNAQLYAVALWQRNPWLASLSDYEYVLKPRGKGVADVVFDVDDLKRSRVAFEVRDVTHTTDVVPASDHDSVAHLELDMVENLATGNVHSHGIVCLDIRVRVAQRPAVVGDGVGDTLGAPLDLLHAAQLVGGLLLGNLVQHEAAFRIVEQPKILPRFVNLHHVHESSWVEHVRPGLAVHLDQALHCDHLAFAVGERVLESLPEEDNQWQTLPHLVWPGRGLWGPAAFQLVEHPLRWSEHALEML